MTIAQDVKEKLQQIAQRAKQDPETLFEVYRIIQKDDAFVPSVILQELDWFFGDLGLDPYYFQSTPAAQKANHIKAIYAGKILGQTNSEDIGLSLKTESENMAMYASSDVHEEAVRVERRLEERFPLHRVQSYRTSGTIASDSDKHLRLYFLSPSQFDKPEVLDQALSQVQRYGTRSFLANTPMSAIHRYQGMLERIEAQKYGPVFEFSDKPDANEKRLMIGYHRDSTHSYFSAISDVINSYDITSNRKYIEHFSNGVVIHSIYIDNQVTQDTINSITEDLSLLYVLPRTALTPMFREGMQDRESGEKVKLTAQEVVYAYAGWKFAHQFLTRYSDEYQSLAMALENDPVRLGLLGQMRSRLSKDTFTEGRIRDTIFAHPNLIKALYQDFARYNFSHNGSPNKPFNREHGKALEVEIEKSVNSYVDSKILNAFLNFNRHILKTNFYKDNKLALSFRLDPEFLSQLDYPETPFGVFFVLGSEFRGFHIRFREIARGGIRIIRSANTAAYTHNTDYLFDENYNLALTQQKKNKDIPEGGSKGTVLLSLQHQDKAETAFYKYVDSLIDLMMPNEEIVDHWGKEELLFLGPDEGTADVMNWASRRAEERGYRFPKAFTTGKSVDLGGIPHDRYGMTTRSIRQYVLGSLRKLKREEKNITKAQTGGPDGDLGSNEIKISHDITLSIVDGSGVLYDPKGIDREELMRLAEARQMVAHFDRSKINEGGFLVLVEDQDVTLPNGQVFESGRQLRNTFHLEEYSSSDLFVPCGGRPNSVHINNVHKLFDAKEKPRFQIIIEGANLFFTQEARLHLEDAGCIVYKDASTNKGGVTSSSLEVLASLALSKEEFQAHMQVQNGVVPDFYQRYVEEVQDRIRDNADLEFEAIWKANEDTGIRRCELTDQLSNKINEINDRIRESKIKDNPTLWRNVLAEACPKKLLTLIDLDTFLKRVPQAYLEAIFGAHIASRYVYTHGMDANEVDFVSFIQQYM